MKAKLINSASSLSIAITIAIFIGTLSPYRSTGTNIHSDSNFSCLFHLGSFYSQTLTMNFDYNKAWEQVEKYDREGLPKSAFEIVKEILANARKENKNDQFIKALIYKGKYQSQLEENGLAVAMANLESEMQMADFPAKSILQSMLAEMYASYLDNNYWKFQNRTETVDFKSDDIQTWSIGDLTKMSNQLYWESLSNASLKEIPIENFTTLLVKGENGDYLRPTLYDFLAHRAIDHFTNERNYLSQPAYKFEIESPAAFASVNEFIDWEIISNDSTSNKLQTLKLFQNLLRFRYSNAATDIALLDANLKRLKFVWDNSILENKNLLYENALSGLKIRYKGTAGEAEINYEIAQLYYFMGQNYVQPPFGEADTSNLKWMFKMAFELCDLTIKNHPNTVAASNCFNLKSNILSKDLRLETEMVNLIEKPFLAKISYQNIPRVYVRLIRFSENEKESFEKLLNENNWQEKALQYLKECKTIESWQVELPDPKDFRPHSTEIAIPALPGGLYSLVISEKEDFEVDNGLTGYVFTHVSNIGYWERQNEGALSDIVVFDRTTGKPIEGAKVEFWVQEYNSITRKYHQKKRGDSYSDNNGFVKSVLSAKNDRNYYLRIIKGKDILAADQRLYNNIYDRNQRPYQSTQFFLDRAIYRPGQTIFFKALALNFDRNRMPTILKNEKVIISFKDVNYQEVATLNLVTNEYGTVSGQFIAPRGGLLGNMQLVSTIGRSAKSFRVEEYKRPKFEVAFEPFSESYKLNDTVTATAKATAYAGNQVDGAKVKWRVVRQSHFPWYWRSWYWPPFANQTVEIANGETITDDKGEFKIEFTALPDKEIQADRKPEFHYTIYADVTDITGETRSGQTSMRVGYVAMQIDLPLDANINAATFDSITIKTLNLNGQFEPATGSVLLEKLEAPKSIFIDRFWEEPDQRNLSEGEFKKKFPNYTWNKEDQPLYWPVDQVYLNQAFNTANSQKIAAPKLKPGWYSITVKSADKYGTAVELKKFFQVFDLESNSVGHPTLLWDHIENKPFLPGEIAKLLLRSSTKQMVLVELVEVIKGNITVERKWLSVNNTAGFERLIEEHNRGGLTLNYSYAGLNRAFTNTKHILVPWDNKVLNFEYVSFRDKLKPGQEEEWIIKLKGPNSEITATEMVAGMYDASLDAFASNYWGINIFPNNFTNIRYTAKTYEQVWLRHITGFSAPGLPSHLDKLRYRSYDRFNWFNWYLGGSYYMDGILLSSYATDGNVKQYAAMRAGAVSKDETTQGKIFSSEEIRNLPTRNVNALASLGAEASIADESMNDNGEIVESNSSTQSPPVQIRENLNETVFFYPNLMTDEEGNILIKFKMNEALTRWKFMGFAHTPDLKSGVTTKEVVTQKELMVVPNPPRFFRENDEIEFTAKVVNLTDKKLSGNAELLLANPINSMPVFKWLDNPQFNQNFTVEANQSARVAWRFKVPDVAEVPVIEHTVIATAGDYADGEKAATPVLTNRMLVTESKPLPVRGGETKHFVLNSLKDNHSPTLRHQSLTLEFTQNPAWYAVQALPYLMEYPYECTEQVFNRYYANSLATSVANSHPKIKAVFEKWRDYEPDALLSNLSKNQELKSALLEETPWVLHAQSEEQQKQNIGLLFDLNRMSYELDATLRKLQDRQLPGGGWSWFPGGRDNWYITQYIVEGFGHLQQLNAIDMQENDTAWRMIEQAVKYCDDRMAEEYDRLERLVNQGLTTWKEDHLSYMAGHYLYTRSFFLQNASGQAGAKNDLLAGNRNVGLTEKAEKVRKYYLSQAENYWLKKGIYSQGMLALALNRRGMIDAARKIVKSLNEFSLNHEEMGMYWKYPTGWWWYQAPIETHSLMIEVFDEVANDQQAVDDLKVWLLKNKQTTHWKTTKATSNAVYALLRTGDNWLLDDQPLAIKFGNKNNQETQSWNKAIAKAQKNAEAGTGYFKLSFEGDHVTNDMADIQISNPNKVVAWGGIYWQYFEQLDKIKTFKETPLTLKKQLFRVKNSDRGEVMEIVNEGDRLNVGEKLHVRIELRVDRDMEYVHMKDMRASGFEPMNVLSQYKWQGGLGYYESTRDVATNFFFTWLPKGTYVFEYPLRVVHNGDFSNGVTTIQSMYAPEFTSHSAGIRVEVGE